MGGLQAPAEGFANTLPRYAAYCRVHGATSRDEMLARDRIEWPGGRMCGYILWIRQQQRAFAAQAGIGSAWDRAWDDADHVNFDRWLADLAERPHRDWLASFDDRALWCVRSAEPAALNHPA